MHNVHGANCVEVLLQNLGKCILKGLQDDEESRYVPKCCRENKKKSHTCCSKCGKSLAEKEWDEESLSYEIADICSGTNDSNPHEVWEYLNANGWVFWGNVYKQDTTTFDNVVIIYEHGEMLLASAALGKLLRNKEEWDSNDFNPKKSVLNCMVVPNGIKVFKDEL
jgi:hypothetical protein